MHVVIMGCGRVGSALARSLEALGHAVAIIDRDAGAFRHLPAVRWISSSAVETVSTITGMSFRC